MNKIVFSSEDLARRTSERRAVEAAIWGMPLVNTDAMRQAYFRDVGAKYNDICFFSTPADWHFQVTTPNASTNYVYFNFNLKDGPVVVEIPAAVGAGLLGSMVNAWDEPMADILWAYSDASSSSRACFTGKADGKSGQLSASRMGLGDASEKSCLQPDLQPHDHWHLGLTPKALRTSCAAEQTCWVQMISSHS